MFAVVQAGQALRDLDEFPGYVIDHLPAVVPCDSLSYNEVDLTLDRLMTVLRPETARFPGDFEILATLLDQNPLVVYHRDHKDGRAVKVSDFISDDDFRSREVYRQLRTNYQIAFSLPAPEPLIIGIALNRWRRDFSERDRLVLNTLRPHLEQVHRRLKLQSQLRRVAAVFNQTLAAASDGIVTLQASGEIDVINEAAEQFIERVLGEPVRSGGRLRSQIQSWVERQRRGLIGVPDGSADAEALVLDGDQCALVCRYLPALRPHEQDMLILEDHASRLDALSFAGLGLTPRESQVMALAAQGRTSIEISAELGASVRTVRKHLEHVYRKLGVTNRGAALAAVTSIARRP